MIAKPHRPLIGHLSRVGRPDAGRLLALSVFATAVACGGADDVARTAFEQQYSEPMLTPASEVVVLARPSGSPQAVDLEAHLVYELSGADLVSVGDVAFVPDGGLVVLDAGALQLLVTDAAGQVARSFGRRGDGPGDFRRLRNLLVPADGDRIGAWDPGLRRATYLAGDLGSVESTVSLGGEARPIMLPGVGGLRHVVERGATRVGLVYPDPFGGVASIAHVVSLDDGMAPVDTLLSFLVPVTEGRRSEGEGSSIVHIDSPPIFSPEAALDGFADGALVFAPGGPYAVFIVDAPVGGSPGIVQVVREWEHRTVRREDRIEAILHGMQEGQVGRVAGMAQAAQARLIERISRGRFASVFPAVRRVVVEEPDHFWVQRWAPDEEPSIWDCYDRSGTALGSFTLPPRTRLLRGAGGRMVAVTADELGTERVVVLRLACAADGSGASSADGLVIRSGPAAPGWPPRFRQPLPGSRYPGDRLPGFGAELDGKEQALGIEIVLP